jgi:adenylyltransferase/sulfurtransferase
MDYVFFCGAANPPSLLTPSERVSPRDYREKHPEMLPETAAPETKPHTLIDVREKAQFDICSLESSINIPISTILASSARAMKDTNGDLSANLPPWLPADIASQEAKDPVYVVCRLGNDSQVAVQKLKELGVDRGGERFVGDIRGGLHAWREQVDPELPEY